MRLRLIQLSIILVVLFNYELPTAATPLGPQFGGGLSAQQSHFGEGIRDWFVNMKDRIFGNSPPNVAPVLSQARDDIDREKKAVAGFLLDLTRVSFDPARDWGFHVGRWYFIKKGKDTPAGGMTNPPTRSAVPEDPQVNWFEDNTSKDQSEFTEATETVPMDSTTIIQPEESSEKASNYPASTPVIDEKDNETYNRAEGAPSAEVIGPNS